MTAPLRFPHAVPPAGGESKLRGRTYTSGFSDALGDRLLARGPGAEPLLEVLEFTQELSDSPDFERALRARVESLRSIRQNLIAEVHSVERPEGMGLCLVSEHIAGRRLSELAPADLGPAFALDVIRIVTPALSELNQAGVGIAHGALSADRVVLAPDGQLVVVEHVLGWAIESLRFSRRRLNDLGIVVGASDPPRFDGRTDLLQLGFLALSLALRRRLDPADCPARVPALLDGSADDHSSPMLPAMLRVWLERAMQIGLKPFASVDEAVDALDEVQDEPDVLLDDTEDALLEFPSEEPLVTPTAPAATTRPTAPPATPARAASLARPAAPTRESAAVKTADVRTAPVTPAAATSPDPRLRRLAVWILGAVSLVATGVAVALVFVAYTQTPADATNVPAPPAQAAVENGPVPQAGSNPANQAAIGSANPAVGASAAGTVPPPPVVAGRAAPAARLGSVRITSAIVLQVFLDGKQVGTTAGPITLREGTHRLEVVNDALEFRQTQVVRIASDQSTSARVVLPNGQISLNATPWAEVSIDGAVVGETPIANYSLPIGSHEIVFRHPQLGVRRQSVMVKANTPVRVAEAFRR